jgi:hypothetical protein
MARAEQLLTRQTETPEFKRFFGDWDAAAKVKPETKPSLLVQNQRQFPKPASIRSYHNLARIGQSKSSANVTLDSVEKLAAELGVPIDTAKKRLAQADAYESLPLDLKRKVDKP